MNAVMLKNGKFWLVPDVPKRPDQHGIFSSQYGVYLKECEQVLSNSIEVAEESSKKAENLIWEKYFPFSSDWTPTEGHVYPIEGLKYELDKEGKAIINPSDL